MTRRFKAHYSMMLRYIKPFLFVLLIPLARGLLQYVTKQEVGSVLLWEAALVVMLTIYAVSKYRSFELICAEDNITIQSGVFIKTRAVIPKNKLSSVQSKQGLLDYIFNSITFRINTEAGAKNKSDFEFKLSRKNAQEVSLILYGKKKTEPYRFSPIKIAVLAATTSSALSGMLLGVPIINQTGKLLGIALQERLLEQINNVSASANNYFPPVVNTVSLIFLICYAFSFIYLFFKFVNFKLFLEKDRFEVRHGLFTRTRTLFKKKSLNNVRIEQSPLMLLFGRYSMKVSVGGFGESKSESQVLVPSGRKDEIKRDFLLYFPFLEPEGEPITPKKDATTKERFLFWPSLLFMVIAVISLTLAALFKDFGRLVLFLTLVTLGFDLYYALLCLLESKTSRLQLGDNILAASTKIFRSCELYCEKENIGQIRISQNPVDRKRNTCRVRLTVRSESADSIRVRYIPYNKAKSKITEVFGINL